MASGSEDDTDDSDDLSDDLSEEVSSNYDNRCTLVFRNTIAMIQRLNARGANISPGMTAFIIGAVGQDWVSIHEYMLLLFSGILQIIFLHSRVLLLPQCFHLVTKWKMTLNSLEKSCW